MTVRVVTLGTDLSGCTQSDLASVVFRLNQRSRTTLSLSLQESRVLAIVASTH